MDTDFSTRQRLLWRRPAGDTRRAGRALRRRATIRSRILRLRCDCHASHKGGRRGLTLLRFRARPAQHHRARATPGIRPSGLTKMSRAAADKQSDFTTAASPPRSQ